MASTVRNAAIVLTATGLLSMGCVLVPRSAGPRVVASGPSRSHTRSVKNFKAVEIGIGSKVEIEVGPAASLEIIAPDNVEKVIDASVVNEVLLVDTRANISGNSEVTLKIKTPKLEGITVLGASTITANKFSSKTMSIVINGAGKLQLEGSCDDLAVTINGTGEIELEKFSSKSAAVQINGAGHVKVAVKESLAASIRGSGDISYLGTPQVTKSILGTGTISGHSR